VLKFKSLKMLVLLQINQVIKLSPTVVVVCVVFLAKEDVVYFDIQMDIPQFVELFNRVDHLNSCFQNVDFPKVEMVSFQN
jgi:hypothetical protein